MIASLFWEWWQNVFVLIFSTLGSDTVNLRIYRCKWHFFSLITSSCPAPRFGGYIWSFLSPTNWIVTSGSQSCVREGDLWVGSCSLSQGPLWARLFFPLLLRFFFFPFILYASISSVGSCLSRVLPKKGKLGKHI